MQIAEKYYLNYLAKFIANNRYYRDNIEKIIDFAIKNIVPIMATLLVSVAKSSVQVFAAGFPVILRNLASKFLAHYDPVNIISKQRILLQLYAF